MLRTVSEPSPWQTLKFETLFKLASGATKPKDLVAEPDHVRRFPVYGGNGVMGYSSFSNADGENIVIGRVGANCGCVHYVVGPCWITDNAPFTSQRKSDFNTAYISYLLEHLGLARLRGQSGQPLITQGPIHSLMAAIAPYPAQCKIAKILLTWDEAIEKLARLRAANLRRRVWLRTHLLSGRIRLPRFAGLWREVHLSDVLRQHGQTSTGSEEVYSVSVHKGLVNQVEHLGRSFAAAETGHYNRVLPGDIVYTKSPTGDFPLGIIKQSRVEHPVIVSPLYGAFTPSTRALGVMLDAYFESPVTVRNYLHPLVQKGAKNTIAITNSRFLQGKLNLPMDPAEQAAIADVVETSRAELAGIGAEIKALSRQKRGLMQKLLTGEWRVKLDSEKEAAA